MRLKSSLLALATAAALSAPGVLHAQSGFSLFPGGPLDLSGGGLGNTNPILTLQAQGNSGTASGCVGLLSAPLSTTYSCNGATNTFQNQSQIYTASQVAGLNATNLGIVFNAAEPGGGNRSIDLSAMTLTFYNSTTGAAVGTVNLVDPMNNLLGLPGTGNYGYLFTLNATGQTAYASALTAVGGAANLSLGLSATVGNAQGGNESFVLVNTGSLTLNTVPEPSTYVLMGSGLLALGVFARRRRA